MIYYKSAPMLPPSHILRMSNVNMIRIVEFQPKCCRYRSKSSQIHSYSPVSALYSHQSPSCITPASKIPSVQNRANIQSVSCTAEVTPILLCTHTSACAAKVSPTQTIPGERTQPSKLNLHHCSVLTSQNTDSALHQPHSIQHHPPPQNRETRAAPEMCPG
jgi:hypothetical protein